MLAHKLCSWTSLACLLSICDIGTHALPAAGDDAAVAKSSVVDLGYALYRPTQYNETGQYYNFSNIRYAAPPLAALRFSDPQPPLQDRSVVNDGSVGYACIQAAPLGAGGGPPSAGSPVPMGLSGQQQSEDCLFLDVIVPEEIFKEKGNQKLAPVMFNIHGGGFYSGDKGGLYNPRGLLERGKNSFIYVSTNYRLGAFGFLSNLAASPSNVTSPNAGLLDQRMALKWVQRNIHLFGGDRNKVTIIGESAGGSSVVYHTVAYGGSKPEENTLFQQAISQSAGVEPIYPEQAAKGAGRFLESAGVTSVDEARKATKEVLFKANQQANEAVPFLVFSFAPSVDGKILPDLPLRLMNQGKFNQKLNVVAAHNNRETVVSVGTTTVTDEDIRNYLITNLPEATQPLIEFILNTLYPAVPGNLPYTNNQERLQLLRNEHTLSCSSYHLAKAFRGRTHNYIFSIPPATQGQDLAYTYYPTSPTIGFIPERAVELQKYLVEFVLHGNTPTPIPLPTWPYFGSMDQARALNITAEGILQADLDQADQRCEWWNQALYRPSVQIPDLITADTAGARELSGVQSTPPG